MDLIPSTATIACANGTATWTITGAVNLDGVYPGHKLFVGSRNADVPSAPIRMFRIATIDRTAKTFTTYDNADQAYSSAPFFIDMDGTEGAEFASFLFTVVLNQLVTMFGVGSTQFAGGGSAFVLPRDSGASSVAKLAFQLRSGASTFTDAFFWRQRQVSGVEMLELVASPDGTAELSVLSVNRATGAITFAGDQAASVTLRGDAAYTILSTDRDIIINAAFTVGRTFTLPANSARALNGRIRIIDGAGAISTGTPLTFARAGSDTINGGTTFVVTRPRAVIDIIKTGTGQWTIDPDLAGDAATRGLNAILATASDVVDVMVYDTRLDSDGGTWRHKCAHTSWYNEAASATRGSRKEFPLIAGLVLRGASGSGTLLIYDLTDFDGSGVPRLWMSFAGGSTFGLFVQSGVTPTSVFALNGRIWAASGVGNGALSIVNFVADEAATMVNNNNKYFPRPIASRNVTQPGFVTAGFPAGLVDRVVNHVHARVYPDAPLDGAGLPIPTIAVATGGGVSVIHPWGAVYDLVYSAGGFTSMRRVFLTADGRVLFHSAGSFAPGIGAALLPYADVSTTLPPEAYQPTSFPAVQASASGRLTNGILARADGVFVTGNAANGLTFLAPDRGSPTSGMVSYIAIAWATGWQVGDIRIAALCDATTGNLAAANPLACDGVANLPTAGGTNSVASVSGEVEITYGSGSVGGSWNITTVVGAAYVLRAKIRRGTAPTIRLDVRSSPDAELGVFNTSSTTNVDAVIWFTATTTTSIIRLLFPGSPSVGQTIYADDIYVDLAANDRSYKAKGLRVVGTLSRAVVNTGNDLAAFSGFSASNYLEQPYNSDLDFGTGDYAYLGWFKSTAAGRMFRRADTGLSGARVRVDVSSGGLLQSDSIDAAASQATIASTATVNDGSWHFFSLIRRSGVTELWLDGVRVGTSSSAAGSMSNTTAVLRIGLDVNAGSNFPGSLALLRVSATAPTTAQIARMYRDEAPLFNAGAKACLGGTSNAVADLAYDESRNVTLIGTADGVSEFSGLNRTAYHDTSSTALTNDAMTAVASAAGYRLMAGGAQAIAFRETANLLDVIERYPPRQRDVFKAFGRTTDATPTNLAPHIYVGERETVSFIAEILARQVGVTATEYARYLVNVSAKRDAGGNVTVTNVTTTTQEVTAGMDAAAVAVTASQTIALQVTGKAATTLVWSAEIQRIVRVSEELSYAA